MVLVHASIAFITSPICIGHTLAYPCVITFTSSIISTIIIAATFITIRELIILRISLNVFTKACARVILSCLCFIHKKHYFFSLSYQHSLHGGPSLNFDVSIIFCSLDDNTLMIYFYFPFSSLLGHIIYSNATTRLHTVS